MGSGPRNEQGGTEKWTGGHRNSQGGSEKRIKGGGGITQHRQVKSF